MRGRGQLLSSFFSAPLPGQVQLLFAYVFESMAPAPRRRRSVTPEARPPAPARPASPKRSDNDSYTEGSEEASKTQDEEVKPPSRPDARREGRGRSARADRHGGRRSHARGREGRRDRSDSRRGRGHRGEKAGRAREAGVERKDAPRSGAAPEKKSQAEKRRYDRSTSASTVTRAARQSSKGSGTKGKGKQKKVQCQKCWGWYAREGLDFHQRTSETCLAAQVYEKQEVKNWEQAKQAAYEIRLQKEQEWKDELKEPKETEPPRGERRRRRQTHATANPSAPAPPAESAAHGDRGTADRDRRRRRREAEEDKMDRHSRVFSAERYRKEKQSRR